MKKNDQMAVNALRMLSVDAINKANSGHPGICLGAAPMAYTLWSESMVHNPEDPDWTNRDRFVLSAGHGSALLYSLLCLSGYGLTLEDMKSFRQLGSLTPGHPEWGHTRGVEATTGPLGQGFSNAVGMAMAEAHLAAVYNRPSYPVVDHYTYCICGDGDLMEGVSAEAASLAGTLKLGKLIVLYDSNDICLDGPTDKVFQEDTAARFAAYHWQVLTVEDGNDLEAIKQALEEAKANTEIPTLIEVKTVIGFGSPKEGTNAVHGSPIGEEGTKALREKLGWDYEPFEIPQEVSETFRKKVGERGEQAEEKWDTLFAAYKKEYPELARQYEDAFAGRLPEGWEDCLPEYQPGDKAEATRSSSGQAIQAIAREVPAFWGGSADLSSSNKTLIKESGSFRLDSDADRNIWYGVREFAMAGINNGIAYHGGSKIFGATFFVFSDYLRGAARVAALSRLPVIYVMTHDSVAVGEDGPTHEPVETLASWRAMPGLDLIRPADGNEVSASWKCAMESKDHPTMLVLSRQNLPNLEGTEDRAMEGVERGAYVLSEAKGEPDGIFLASGSEVSLCVEAQQELEERGIHVRVVSMPSWFRFEAQDAAYKESVLPPAIKRRISIEAGSSFGWDRYVGDEGHSIGINRFGLSGKGDLALEELGISKKQLVETYLHYYGSGEGEE